VEASEFRSFLMNLANSFDVFHCITCAVKFCKCYIILITFKLILICDIIHTTANIVIVKCIERGNLKADFVHVCVCVCVLFIATVSAPEGFMNNVKFPLKT